MGMMINGVWQTDDGIWASKDGQFRRSESQFRGGDDFMMTAGRYHLYVSLACPWAHRTLIMRQIKNLEAILPVTVVHPHMLNHGWEFRPEPEPVYGFRHAWQLYAKADPHYSGRVSVPILWDKKRQTIVCNESAEIIRIFNQGSDHGGDLYPAELRSEIDAINDFIYPNINNGVYRCGFARTQQAYHEAFDVLFSALDELETHMQGRQFLVGEQLTEADIRLFTTLIRFDPVYVGHFKCNRNRIVDMPQLWAWLQRMWQIPACRETTDFAHIKEHYYYSHDSINPTRIVPVGPRILLEGAQ